MFLKTLCFCFVVIFFIVGCQRAPNEVIEFDLERSSLLSAAERRERLEMIRDAAIDRGLLNPLILAGIANHETHLAHCHSEWSIHCEGPYSADCGGPVLAGSGDGPCSLRQGGLGMFQFDAGTHSETLAREGERILSVAGNTQAAVDFVVSMVIRSTHISGVSDEDEALTWMNAVRVDNSYWDPWITTVTHYYNGCSPTGCSIFERRWSEYSDDTIAILDEMGEEFWYGHLSRGECEPIPSFESIIDETDGCFEPGGDPRYLRTVTDDGWDGGLIWTHATAYDTVYNYAIWHLNFEEAGDYTIEAYTDATWAESTMTTYEIHHNGITEEIVIDQTSVDGWNPIGEFEFASGENQWIRVNDNTGEDSSTDTRIVFDAIRITPIDTIHTCPEGYEYDESIGECVEIPSQDCPEGFEIDPHTGECVEIITTDCPEGFIFESATGECIEQITTECPEGYEPYGDSGLCIEIRSCPEGSRIDEATGLCVEISGPESPSLNGGCSTIRMPTSSSGFSKLLLGIFRGLFT